MVKNCHFGVSLIYGIALLACHGGVAYGSDGESEYITQSISADACDDRLVDDDEHTAENRAVDKAGLAAVKVSGIIQRFNSELNADAIDTIAYRIIDEYMVNVAHAIKYSDSNRVCVKLTADVDMTSDDMKKLIEEYKDSDPQVEQVVEIVKKVNDTTTFKPQNLNEKKLLYVRKMLFWNGNETGHYSEFINGLFSNSEYFYVTDDENIADFVVTPRLTKSEVDEIDLKNHKMEMTVELEVISPTDKNFLPLIDKQSHFILFANDKDEQKIADDLLRKLLAKGVKDTGKKIDKYSAQNLEKSKLKGL